MKNILLSVVAASVLATGLAHADGLKREITITAQIDDSIFVSKPDGSTWYDKEELIATDYKQLSFASKDLPVRVYTKTAPAFNVSLTQPLSIVRGDGVSLANTKVSLAGKDVNTAGVTTIQQLTQLSGGDYDDTYTLKITADAPTTMAGTSAANGQYQGDLVMLFEAKP